ncbi:DUF6344 domain-containing protein [Streptomyces nitrosporeus]|uniref:DUF6344 domain-containing protein n=1 Tax=Streptomyces nitrosporeus TaxID=28894 RepID=UPI00331F78E0
MRAFKVENLWTALVTAFFAILASLGFATPAQAADTAANTNAAAGPAPTHRTHTAAAPATAAPPSVRWTLPRDRALPPTMKQRIRAEAHGSSPAARQLAADVPDTARGAHGTRAGLGTAPARDAAPLPP